MLLLAGAAALLALMAGLWLWTQKPVYRVLFANYADRDGGAIVAALQQMNVPYQIADGGGAILVPAAQVHDVRLKLASQGLPKGSGVGFELMENQKLGSSQFLEQVNFQRALEGELARTIQALATVQAARVHLAIPKASVFVRDQQKPTASVLLNLHPGRALDPQQVSAIVHLVASSVPELTVANVTVVDQQGHLLSEQRRAGAGNPLDPSQLSYIDEIQQAIARRIEAILTPIVGAQNVHAEVSADIDFSSSEQAAESYRPNPTPDSAAIRSQQQSAMQSTGTAAAGGVPGALSNTPPQPATAPLTTAPAAAGAASATPSTSQKDSTTQYELDKTLRVTQQPMGGIKRLSVAVVVNHRSEINKQGKPVTRALTDAEKVAITDLVKEAMGFSKERGDTPRNSLYSFSSRSRDSVVSVSSSCNRAPSWISSIARPICRPSDTTLLLPMMLSAFLASHAARLSECLRPVARPSGWRRVSATACAPGRDWSAGRECRHRRNENAPASCCSTRA